MKFEPLVERNNGDDNASAPFSSNFCPTPEFEPLFEWVRLGASHVRKNAACIDEHRQSLRARGETQERLGALDYWRQSHAFTEREKAALLAALEQCNGNKKKAAELLGIHRPTLYTKLRKFGLGV